MKRPNFFIVGAPKCGTTSLASWLKDHPQVFMSPVKEPHYFSTDFNRGDFESLIEYEKLFEKAGPDHVAVGEASTEYLYSERAVPNIEAVYPGSRYIVMVRNPVELAFSLYKYEKAGGREVLETFREAWDKSPERRKGECVGPWCSDPQWLDYQQVASMGYQLARLYFHVDESRVLVLFLSDVKENPIKEYRKVICFLGLNEDGRQSFPSENVGRGNKSRVVARVIRSAGMVSEKVKKAVGLPVYKGSGILRLFDRLNSSGSGGDVLEAEIRQEMIGFFYKDIEVLAKLTNRDLSEWLGHDAGNKKDNYR
jgi:hypothetical protein